MQKIAISFKQYWQINNKIEMINNIVSGKDYLNEFNLWSTNYTYLYNDSIFEKIYEVLICFSALIEETPNKKIIFDDLVNKLVKVEIVLTKAIDLLDEVKQDLEEIKNG